MAKSLSWVFVMLMMVSQASGMPSNDIPTHCISNGALSLTDKLNNNTKDNYTQDDDNDKVVNAQDACPNTPVGVMVNNYGCPKHCLDCDQEPSVRLEYQTNESYPMDLQALETAMYRYYTFWQSNTHQSKVCWLVKGHRSAIENIKIDEQRAMVARQLLIERFGVDSKTIKSQGYGMDYPFAPNDDKHRHLNQRVDVLFFITSKSEYFE